MRRGRASKLVIKNFRGPMGAERKKSGPFPVWP